MAKSKEMSDGRRRIHEVICRIVRCGFHWRKIIVVNLIIEPSKVYNEAPKCDTIHLAHCFAFISSLLILQDHEL